MCIEGMRTRLRVATLATLLVSTHSACSAGDPSVRGEAEGSDRDPDGALDGEGRDGGSSGDAEDWTPQVTPVICGDGVVIGAEACDDKDTTPGDGCSASCAIEPGWACAREGEACVPARCGDTIAVGSEECDDGGQEGGDGCASSCKVEDGYACPSGSACAPVCGDGKVRGSESCDDANNTALAGCSASCQLEPGFKCPAMGGDCSPAICGNREVEGLEECDDTASAQRDAPYDGCYQCKLEPSCTTGACTSRCGDGLKLANEVCDDGNSRAGDGCNASCTALEPGFSCQNAESAPPRCIDLPLILRDFKSHDVAGGHPDFNHNGGGGPGLVWDTLGTDADANAEPDSPALANTKLSVVYKPTAPSSSTSGAANFNAWYHDSAFSKVVQSTLQLCDDGSGTYVFDDRTFYPLDNPLHPEMNKGWSDPLEPAASRETLLGPDSSFTGGCAPMNADPQDPDADVRHNFGFTSELRFWFTYKGGEKLTFRGDDDVWVFIAGKLVIDLGGVHCAQTGAVTLIAGEAVYDTNGDGVKDAGESAVALDLQAGNVYETVVFQAERHVSESSYRLTLGKFFKTVTACEPVCGDGVRTAGELCDSGGMCMGGDRAGSACSVAAALACPGGACQTLNDGGYGHCGASCKSRGPYCGDRVKNTAHGEECDDGNASNLDGCSVQCKALQVL
jgi:fibro-slime domain-containing protein